jgi:ABC-type Fe3+ transport system substrate-binding protein
LHVQKSVEVVEAVRNGAPSGMDVFWSTAARIEVLKRGNVLAAVDWAGELGLDPALKWGDHGLRAHDGMLTNLVFNTEMVKADQVPRTYADLLNPRWKGRIAIPRSPSPWVNLSFALGEDATVALVTALMRDQQAKILPRYPDVIARVVNGEFPIGIGADAHAQIVKGAPIGQADLDILVIVPWAYAITGDAHHPAAAKLWGYWAVSPDGQAALDRVHGLSSVLAPGTSMWKFAQGKKVHIVSYDYAVEHEDRLSAKFGQILGIVR